MARLQYNPNTIIPSEMEGLVKFIQEELDKISFTFANITVPASSIEDPDTGEPVEVITDHGDLTGLESFDSHPISAITGLAEEQEAQDVLIDQNTRVFFQPTQPSDAESSAGDIWFESGYD